MSKIIHRYTALELNTIFQLRSEGYSMKDITYKINERFNSNRTEHKIMCKLSHLNSKAVANKKRKLTNDDKIIEKYVKRNSTNIRYGLELASKELNTTFEKVNNRYYKHLKYTITMLTVGSEMGFTNNVKNTPRDINGNLPTPDMNDVQWLMKQILNLSEKDRNTIKLLLN